MTLHQERLILAVAHVTDSTKACATAGDAAMSTILPAYYALAAEAVTAGGGMFVKTFGDGVLLTFPPDRARVVIEGLRKFQQAGTTLWQGLDARCRVQVKVAIGSLLCGLLGPPGDERLDVIGNALNVLFKAPWQDFVVSSEVLALAETAPPD